MTPILDEYFVVRSPLQSAAVIGLLNDYEKQFRA
jgi:hypothetical protein